MCASEPYVRERRIIFTANEGKNMSIYQRYCREILDEKGRLINFELDYPENFNFGYDVVDVIAKESPEKRLSFGAIRIMRAYFFI